MKIGSIIVSYNPDIELLKENIDAIIKQVDRVLIVDNGSRNIVSIKELSDQTGAFLIDLSTNMGIATALNKGMAYFQKLHYDWVLTLDQDSVASDNLISKLTSVSEFTEKDVGIIAADFMDMVQGERESTRSESDRHSRRVITSGSLTNVRIWEYVGGFDEQLFIDSVDYDFNQRIISLGFKIFQVNEVYIRHSLGEGIKTKNNFLTRMMLKQSKGHPTEHSAFRLYYIHRNLIIYAKRYSERPIHDILKSILSMVWIFLFRDPRQKLVSALKGVWDGLKYHSKNDLYFQNYLELKNGRKQFENQSKQ